MSSSSLSSPKRKHPGDDTPRPFKKLMVEVTGLEDDPAMEDITTRTLSTITTSEVDLYVRRRKISRYANLIRRKQAMSKRVRADWVGMPASSQQGLLNFTGAICYRLSLLQALLHQPRFVHWLDDFHWPEDCVSDNQQTCVCCILRLLSQEYWRGSRDSVATSKVLRRMDVVFTSLGWAPDRSSGHADPDEMATWLFTALRSELPSSNYSHLEAIMQPSFTTTICCHNCGYESRTNGHEDRALPVPIHPAISNGTLGMYLQKYMVETVEGYRCNQCKDSTTDKHRKQLIGYAPDILTVQLKRTGIDGRKLNTHVTIDPVLNLTSYRDTAEGSQLRYELNAVIKHRGTLNFGHYISFAKGPDGTWNEYDDKRKTTSTLGAAISSKDNWTPYLLFFQRKKV